MASILRIGDSWSVLIRRKGRKPICKTFRLKVLAERFARETETELEKAQFDAHDPPIKLVIQAHRRHKLGSLSVHKTTLKHLDLVERLLGDLTPAKLTAAVLLEAMPDNTPVARYKYMALLRASLRQYDPPIRTELLDVAVKTLKRMGHARNAKPRDRRPVSGEIERVLAAYKGPMPLADMVAFSSITGVRLGELVRLRWADLDRARMLIKVRDRKHPTNKIGNDWVIPLLGASFEIVCRQPESGDRIFPYNPQSISNAWNKVRARIGGGDLRWHDLRHEAISRMVESGYSIPEVAVVSGHSSWAMLRRYTNLRPEDLHRGPAAGRALQPASTPTGGPPQPKPPP